MRFADTNVLLYSVSTVPEEAAKARKAQALLANRDIALSVQVLQEFYVQATRASRSELAYGAWGIPRSTKDADFVLALPGVELDALSGGLPIGPARLYPAGDDATPPRSRAPAGGE